MRLQSAIFDMDGTLLDSMPAWEHLCSGLIREMGLEPEPDLDATVSVMTMRQGAEYCKEQNVPADDMAWLSEIKKYENEVLLKR